MFTFVWGTHADVDADDDIVRNRNNDRNNTCSRANRWVCIIWDADVTAMSLLTRAMISLSKTIISTPLWKLELRVTQRVALWNEGRRCWPSVILLLWMEMGGRGASYELGIGNVTQK